MMRDYRERPPHEQDLCDWLARWQSRRTGREVRNFLATVWLLQDESGDASGRVNQLLEGGTLQDLEQAMTEAIAYVFAHDHLAQEDVDQLTMPHASLMGEDRIYGA